MNFAFLHYFKEKQDFLLCLQYGERPPCGSLLVIPGAFDLFNDHTGFQPLASDDDLVVEVKALAGTVGRFCNEIGVALEDTVDGLELEHGTVETEDAPLPFFILVEGFSGDEDAAVAGAGQLLGGVGVVSFPIDDLFH